MWDGILLKSIQKVAEVLQQITKKYLALEHPCVLQSAVHLRQRLSKAIESEMKQQ